MHTTEQSGGGKIKLRLPSWLKRSQKKPTNTSHLIKIQPELNATQQDAQNNAAGYRNTADRLDEGIFASRQEANAELTKLNKELTDLEALETCNKTLSQVNNDISELDTYIGKMDGELDKCNKKHDTTQSEFDNAARITKNWNTQTNKAKYEDATQKLIRELAGLQANYEAAHNRLQEMKRRANAHKSLEERKPKPGEIEALRAELAALRAEQQRLLHPTAAVTSTAQSVSGPVDTYDPNEFVLGDRAIEPTPENNSRRLRNARARINTGLRRARSAERNAQLAGYNSNAARQNARRGMMNIPKIQINTPRSNSNIKLEYPSVQLNNNESQGKTKKNKKTLFQRLFGTTGRNETSGSAKSRKAGGKGKGGSSSKKRSRTGII